MTIFLKVKRLRWLLLFMYPCGPNLQICIFILYDLLVQCTAVCPSDQRELSGTTNKQTMIKSWTGQVRSRWGLTGVWYSVLGEIAQLLKNNTGIID